jgi:hypothetical protein
MTAYICLTNYVTAQQTDQLINLPTYKLTNQQTNQPSNYMGLPLAKLIISQGIISQLL